MAGLKMGYNTPFSDSDGTLWIGHLPKGKPQGKKERKKLVGGLEQF